MPPWAHTLLDRFSATRGKADRDHEVGRLPCLPAHYPTVLKANGEDVNVVQELMRHANFSTTMNIYTTALTLARREAQSRVVDVLLDRF
jgi:integrase